MMKQCQFSDQRSRLEFVPVEGYLADKVCVRSHEASLRGEPPAPGELRHAGAELGHVEPECLLEEEQA